MPNKIPNFRPGLDVPWRRILAKCDPIRRQMLGDGVDVKGWWQPTDDDVPLKGWLLENKGEEYVERIGQKQWEREKWELSVTTDN